MLDSATNQSLEYSTFASLQIDYLHQHFDSGLQIVHLYLLSMHSSYFLQIMILHFDDFNQYFTYQFVVSSIGFGYYLRDLQYFTAAILQYCLGQKGLHR